MSNKYTHAGIMRDNEPTKYDEKHMYAHTITHKDTRHFKYNFSHSIR